MPFPIKYILLNMYGHYLLKSFCQRLKNPQIYLSFSCRQKNREGCCYFTFSFAKLIFWGGWQGERLHPQTSAQKLYPCVLYIIIVSINKTSETLSLSHQYLLQMQYSHSK